MGDTPINLNSPEQLSWVIYSRRLRTNSIGLMLLIHTWMIKNFVLIKDTDRLYKTSAEQCVTCKGTGYIRKTKKNGMPFARDSRCPHCDGAGYHLLSCEDVAGLKFKPPSPKWSSANGFSI